MTIDAAGAIPRFELNDRLRKAREYAGLEQDGLAEALGVSRGTVSNAERGQFGVKPTVIKAWAMATGVSAVWLETGHETDNPGPRTSSSMGWGDSLVVLSFKSPGGLKGAVDRIRALLGPTMGTRNTFSKLLRVTDVRQLRGADLFRAWALVTALGGVPSEVGLNDEAVPRHFDVERLRSDLYTTRDSNPEPIDLSSVRALRALAA